MKAEIYILLLFTVSTRRLKSCVTAHPRKAAQRILNPALANPSSYHNRHRDRSPGLGSKPMNPAQTISGSVGC